MLDEIGMATATQSLDPDRSTDKAHTVKTAPVQAEATDLEVPLDIWLAMFAAYAVFFGGLLIATGKEASAFFMVVVSILYAIMYFGTGAILFTRNTPPNRSLFVKGLGPLFTNTGPMSKAAVAGQILTIPFCFALFGIVMVVFRAIIFA